MTAETDSTNPFNGMRAAVKDHLGNQVDEVLPGVYRLRRFRDCADEETELQEGNARFERHTVDIDRELVSPVSLRKRCFLWFAVAALLVEFVTVCLAVWYWVPVTGPK